MGASTRAVLTWAGLLFCACASGGSLDRVPEGSWGGEHVALTVEAAAARVQFDCAHGATTEALKLDSKGRFDVAGYFVTEHGGPSREDGQEERRPGRYVGSSDGRTITFSIRLTDADETLGPFSATLGAEPRLFRCLSFRDPVATP